MPTVLLHFLLVQEVE